MLEPVEQSHTNILQILGTRGGALAVWADLGFSFGGLGLLKYDLGLAHTLPTGGRALCPQKVSS